MLRGIDTLRAAGRETEGRKRKQRGEARKRERNVKVEEWRTKWGMEQQEYHSQLHCFTWWSPSLKGQLLCNSPRLTRWFLTVLSGMAEQEWSQSSGETQSSLHWSEGSQGTCVCVCVRACVLCVCVSKCAWTVFCIIVTIPLNSLLNVTFKRYKHPSTGLNCLCMYAATCVCGTSHQRAKLNSL